ncbi:MAG: DUF2804 domain-containing protein [Oscillospiraceae bacterium]|nr:DUF2804 domain-containing protein [Oscillospiraceae bacterium]
MLKPVDLCTVNGDLNTDSIGWSRKSIINCNLSGRWLRKKKWNYWCTTNDDCLFSVTISNLDYVGMVFIYFLDFKTKKYIEKTVITPFGKGCSMPDNVNETVTFKNGKMEISLINDNVGTHIIAKCGDFDGCSMEADIFVSKPQGYETLNVVIPWNKKSFQFTSKQEGLPTNGTLRVGESKYSFENDTAFSCLDFGRGKWPYNITWNWANASGKVNGKCFGLNLGAKWTDNTGMNENAIVFDGKLTKISEDLIFEYDVNDYMSPWKIRSSATDSVNLEFTPFYERIAKSNMLIIKSEVHQMMGYFSGYVKTQDGEVIELEHFLGCSEDHYAKW